MKRIFNFLNNHKSNGYQSSLFLLLLNYFNIEIPNEAEPIVEFSYNVFLLSLVALTSFINLLFTLFILYYFKNSNYEIRFQNKPIIVKIIKFYLKTSVWALAVETILCLISIFALFYFSIVILKINLI
jgi:hypothetical protein